MKKRLLKVLLLPVWLPLALLMGLVALLAILFIDLVVWIAHGKEEAN